MPVDCCSVGKQPYFKVIGVRLAYSLSCIKFLAALYDTIVAISCSRCTADTSGGHCGHQLLNVLSAQSASRMFGLTPQASMPNPSF